MRRTAAHERGGSNRLDRSTDFEVVCRFLAAIADDFILNDLPFIEGAQSRSLDGGNMDEHVFAAPLRLNESVALGRIEPLHGSCRHLELLALCARLGRSGVYRTMPDDPSFGR